MRLFDLALRNAPALHAFLRPDRFAEVSIHSCGVKGAPLEILCALESVESEPTLSLSVAGHRIRGAWPAQVHSSAAATFVATLRKISLHSIREDSRPLRTFYESC